MKKDTNNNKKVKSIGKKLSVVFAIMLVVSTLTAEVIAIFFGFNKIKELIDTSLQNEAQTNADAINKELKATFYYVNGVGDALE